MPPCTACHLCHSAASSSAKRCLGGSSRDDQRRTDPLHALGTEEAEAETGADPDAAVEVGTMALEAAGSADGPGTCTLVAAEAANGIPVGTSASAAGATPTGVIGVEAPASVTTASATAAPPGAGAPSASDPATAAGVSALPPVAAASSASSASRSITSPA
uniref:Uncharacterized protein n=1 Tax=Setaria viridis TaxID=4556 RepID=A0A4U6WAA9_SETVI|nr:hypothetical protein SEVIR_1G133800v2 [Setaria viridis]